MDYFLTKKKLKELQGELERLKTEGRKEVSDNLRTAKELGDLSENAEYIDAREKQQRVERRIAELEDLVRNAVVIDKGRRNHQVVEVGSTVEAVHGGKTVRFYIVGSNEARPEEGFISNESPLGQALMGHAVGDKVVFKSPRGRAEYTIKKIA